MAVDSAVRRTIAALLFFMVVGIVFSWIRGDSFATAFGYALVGLACGGFVIGCYLWARRKD